MNDKKLNDNRIKVTIILPCLNVVSYIKECLDSAINQTIYSDIEILIIDAGSTDGTLEVASFYEDRYENVRLLESDRKSYGYQVNTGIREAHGEYIAILETDDYVANNAYEILYDEATRFGADYAKGDFERFYVRRNGHKMLEGVSLFTDNSLYNKAIDVRSNRDIFVRDYNIWKGIYRREFLLDNNIFLNESKGAAYQDIGFAHLTHAYAKRAVYVPDFLYKYRVGREGASINSGRGLIYASREFGRLLSMQDSYRIFLLGIYESLLASLTGEIGLLADVRELYNEEIRRSVEWIVSALDKGMHEGYMNKENIEEDGLQDYYQRYLLIKNNYKEFVEHQYKRQKDEKEKYLLLRVDGCRHIIFGAGNYGRSLLAKMDQYDVDIDMIFDNAASEGDCLGGIPVVRPDNRYLQGDVKVFVANKKHGEEIRTQLLTMGVSNECIIDYKL